MVDEERTHDDKTSSQPSPAVGADRHGPIPVTDLHFFHPPSSCGTHPRARQLHVPDRRSAILVPPLRVRCAKAVDLVGVAHSQAVFSCEASGGNRADRRVVGCEFCVDTRNKRASLVHGYRVR